MNSIKNNNQSIRSAFGDTIFELGSAMSNLYVVNVDLKTSLSLDKFANKFRSRFIECGVAESNAAGIAAGLAKSGKTVFLTSFACFSPAINWAVIKQSICYQNLPVIIVGSHAGLLSGDLGATHQMLEDVALMRTLPNMSVCAPIDANETTDIVKYLAKTISPAYLRLVRPSTPIVPKIKFTPGKSQIIQSGSDVTVLGYGPVLLQSLEIKNFKLEIINCSSIKPLDSETILKSIKKTGRCLVIEDHQKNGGLGDAVANLILSSGIKCKFISLGVDNQFGQSAKDWQTLYDHYGLAKKAIINAIKKLL
ncbi:MAG: transketolase family protein [Candidatus Shapirobacteria bacterium]|nr:transketolase family protein [Candidatus Shapirobacteria bacterium]